MRQLFLCTIPFIVCSSSLFSHDGIQLFATYTYSVECYSTTKRIAAQNVCDRDRVQDRFRQALLLAYVSLYGFMLRGYIDLRYCRYDVCRLGSALLRSFRNRWVSIV